MKLSEKDYFAGNFKLASANGQTFETVSVLKLGSKEDFSSIKNAAKEKDDNKKANYGTEGLALGMCFGVAISSAFGTNTGVGLTLGMLLGYAIGLMIEKKENDQTKND